jgi:hypothetical protein
MAAPFGGHPKLGNYIAWANAQGCETKSGYIDSGDGKMMVTRTIYAPCGQRYAPIIDMSENDRLPPSLVRMFDDRLGLDSPFAKL